MPKKKTTTVITPTEVIPATPKDQAVNLFVEDMLEQKADADLRTCFLHAVDITIYMTAVKNKSMVLGSRYVAGAVEAMGVKASEGDVEAAKVLFDYLGLRARTPIAQINTAVQVNIPKVKDIIDLFEDYSYDK